MFIRIPPSNEVAGQLGLTGDDLEALAEDNGLQVFWIRGQRFLSAGDVLSAIHGSKVPRKFAPTLADYPSCHEDLKPPGMTLLVWKIHSVDELCRFLGDLDGRDLFLTYTRETVNIYQA